nr:MAG TPA: hypothetical protein [Caudoviricetes sp.]
MPERNIVIVCTIQCSGEPCSPFVLCVCYDVMKIVYSNLAVNFRHLYNLIHHKICTVTCECSSDHLQNCENSN